MKIAIVGFPGCGKSTCFKAITQKTKEDLETLDPTKPHLAAVKVLDPRLEKIKEFFKPKKITPAEILLEDLPGFHIPQIKEIEALMEVLGIFSGRDGIKDIDDMDVEFMLADLEIINRRLPGLEKELSQDSQSREKNLEHEVLIKCKALLEKNMSLRNLKLATDEERQIRGFQFLSRKPIFILVNIDEKEASSQTVKKVENHCEEKGFKYMEFPGKLESEIADLEEPEKTSFLKELGIKESAKARIVELAYSALGYITFFTTKGSEAKAWPVKKGINAIGGAGKIHSDIQRGFIKAEVINYNDLVSSGSLAGAKKKALLKLEGKEYTIKDGDIIDFKFNI